MKKIELIKEYRGSKVGTQTELQTGRADYLIRMGIAREIDDKGEKKTPNKPKVAKGKTATKAKVSESKEEK